MVLHEELRETTEDYGHAPSFKHCATGQGNATATLANKRVRASIKNEYARRKRRHACSIAALRAAGEATVTALMAGIRAVEPGSSQRMVESMVEDTCWRAGSHGSSFWPWAIGQ